MYNWTIGPHFGYLLDLYWRDDRDQYEYYMLFACAKSSKLYKSEFALKQQELEVQIKNMSNRFVEVNFNTSLFG